MFDIMAISKSWHCHDFEMNMTSICLVDRFYLKYLHVHICAERHEYLSTSNVYSQQWRTSRLDIVSFWRWLAFYNKCSMCNWQSMSLSSLDEHIYLLSTEVHIKYCIFLKLVPRKQITCLRLHNSLEGSALNLGFYSWNNGISFLHSAEIT